MSVNKAAELRNLPAGSEGEFEIAAPSCVGLAMTAPAIGIRTGRLGLPRPPSSGSQ
jgi:hypothetical protein